MSSKEQTDSNDKGNTNQRSLAPATEKLDIAAQPQTHPATIIQRAKLAPSSLTPRDVLQLQRTIGNRAVGRLMAQVIQRKPELESGNIYKDDKYPDVKLEKLKSSIYKIKNDGPYKDRVVSYDTDVQKYYYTEEDKQHGHLQNEQEFDIGLVSSAPPVLANPPTVYDGIGEQGKGVGYVGTDTTLRTSGLLSCVGWLLYNDKAAYLTHIVVLEPQKVVADGNIREQVNHLYNTFVAMTDSEPTTVHIQVDEEQPHYKEGPDKERPVWRSGWMTELVPASCTVKWIRGAADLSYVVQASKGNRKEWDGAAIKVKYSEKS